VLISKGVTYGLAGVTFESSSLIQLVRQYPVGKKNPTTIKQTSKQKKNETFKPLCDEAFKPLLLIIRRH